VADHLVQNQVTDVLNFRGKREGEGFFFSKACESLYRRRFKNIEDAPFAAYGIVHIAECNKIKVIPPEARYLKLMCCVLCS